MAERIDLPEKDSPDKTFIIAAVRRWLEHNSGWLLIFDNAREPKDLEDFLPKGGDGPVIITSRNSFWSSMAKPLPIQIFKRDESVEFLCQRTG